MRPDTQKFTLFSFSETQTNGDDDVNGTQDLHENNSSCPQLPDSRRLRALGETIPGFPRGLPPQGVNVTAPAGPPEFSGWQVTLFPKNCQVMPRNKPRRPVITLTRPTKIPQGRGGVFNRQLCAWRHAGLWHSVMKGSLSRKGAEKEVDRYRC